jgi:hypothetical protein
MSKEELVEALKKYGDHKGSCGIMKILRHHRPPTNSDGCRIYPACSCGWAELIEEIRLM